MRAEFQAQNRRSCSSVPHDRQRQPGLRDHPSPPSSIAVDARIVGDNLQGVATCSQVLCVCQRVNRHLAHRTRLNRTGHTHAQRCSQGGRGRARDRTEGLLTSPKPPCHPAVARVGDGSYARKIDAQAVVCNVGAAVDAAVPAGSSRRERGRVTALRRQTRSRAQRGEPGSARVRAGSTRACSHLLNCFSGSTRWHRWQARSWR